MHAAGQKKTPMDLDSVARTTEIGLASGIEGIEPSPQMHTLNGDKQYNRVKYIMYDVVLVWVDLFVTCHA